MRRLLAATAAVAATVTLLTNTLATTASAGGVTASIDKQELTAATDSGQQRAAGLIVGTTETDTSTAPIAQAAESALPGDTSATASGNGSTATKVISFDEPVSIASAQKAAAAIEKRSDVAWAIPDKIIRASAVSTPPITVDDPIFSRQYSLWDSGRSGGGYSLKAPSLWRSTQGKGVVVAVVDTGILAGHPDLAGQTVAGYDFISSAAEARDGNGRDSDPTDEGDWEPASACGYGDPSEFQASSWHGTHVAGIIAAKADNGIGVSGVAPNVKIQAVRALGECGGSTTDILDAITWASGGTRSVVTGKKFATVNQTPAKVINLSLGSADGTAAEAAADCRLWTTVGNDARARGATLVAAAGNESDTTRFLASRAVPAACPGYLTVGAVSRTGHRAWYSNFGSAVDISAPGGDTTFENYPGSNAFAGIVSTLNSGETTANPNGYDYARYQGTSMAAPAVSAAAALVYSLGVRGSSNISKVLLASTTPFASATANSVNWRKVPAVDTSTGKKYTFNLYCAKDECGTGILNLAKIPAPIGPNALSGATNSGTAAVGSTLKASSSWTVSVPLTTRWYVNGAVVATGSSYTVTVADLGKTVYARTTPSKAPYTGIRTTTSSVTVTAAD